MATTKGTHITDFDATPPDVVKSRLHGGVLKAAVDTTAHSTLGAGDIHHVFKLPIDAIIHSLKFASDDLGTTGTVDIGIYKKNVDGTYSAVDDNAFADAIDVNAAAVALTEYRFSAKNINTANQKLWELAGLSARPSYEDMYISLTFDAATTAAGDTTLMVQYTE